MDPFAAFAEEAGRLVGKAARSLGVEPAALQEPPDRAMGDLALPCFSYAKQLRRAPQDIAEAFAEAVTAQPRTWVARAEAAGPYCNLFIDGYAVAQAVLDDPDTIRVTPTGRRILLEHTSANPNGPLHVGRARNPILGDSLARLLRHAGHEVEVQYYMDNLGRQVALLAWGTWNIPEDQLPPVPEGRDGKRDHVLVRYYQAASAKAKEDVATAEEVRQLVARLEAADPDTVAKVRPVYSACFEGMQQSLARLGVTYDSIKDESDVVQDGSVEEVVTGLKESPRAGVEEDGARYLDLSDLLPGQKDRFYFTRRDGTSVYATRDVAYHAWKARHVDGGSLVNVLGEDHRLQALQVGVALDTLGIPRPHVVFYAFVSLPDGKMSTRANRVVFLDDLMDEAVDRAREEVRQRRGEDLDESQVERVAEAVGIAAIRFNIARVQPEKPIKFRWEDALDFDGDSAPYIMYAYARGASVLRMAEREGIQAAPGALEDGAVQLLAVVARMPQAIRDAADQYAPHRFCAYALQLASAFNQYYRDHRVVGHEDAAQAAARLHVMGVAHGALRTALDVLGLQALETM